MSNLLDRKDLIARDIKQNYNDSSEYKGAQIYGDDSSLLNYTTNDNQYDLSLTIPAGGRVSIDLYAIASGAGAISYFGLYYQLWIGNMSTKYNGSNNSGINVLTLPTAIFQGAMTKSLEVVNTSSNSVTIYLKEYMITTGYNPYLSWSSSS